MNKNKGLFIPLTITIRITILASTQTDNNDLFIISATAVIKLLKVELIPISQNFDDFLNFSVIFIIIVINHKLAKT